MNAQRGWNCSHLKTTTKKGKPREKEMMTELGKAQEDSLQFETRDFDTNRQGPKGSILDERRMKQMLQNQIVIMRALERLDRKITWTSIKRNEVQPKGEAMNLMIAEALINTWLGPPIAIGLVALLVWTLCGLRDGLILVGFCLLMWLLLPWVGSLNW